MKEIWIESEECKKNRKLEGLEVGGHRGFGERMREFREREVEGLKKMKCFRVKGHEKSLTADGETHHGPSMVSSIWAWFWNFYRDPTGRFRHH